jgi:hypothetical protein
MTTPLLVLLGFAAWTILTLFGSIGIYRWSRILTGRASIAEWRADIPQGCDWYQRAMRAHMKCIGNLPIYTALAVALMGAGLQSVTIDHLAIAILAARICQTLTHISTNATTALRFAFFFAQAGCMRGKRTWLIAAQMSGNDPKGHCFPAKKRPLLTSTPMTSTKFPGSKKFFRLGEIQVLFAYSSDTSTVRFNVKSCPFFSTTNNN